MTETGLRTLNAFLTSAQVSLSTSAAPARYEHPARIRVHGGDPDLDLLAKVIGRAPIVAEVAVPLRCEGEEGFDAEDVHESGTRQNLLDRAGQHRLVVVGVEHLLPSGIADLARPLRDHHAALPFLNAHDLQVDHLADQILDSLATQLAAEPDLGEVALDPQHVDEHPVLERPDDIPGDSGARLESGPDSQPSFVVDQRGAPGDHELLSRNQLDDPHWMNLADAAGGIPVVGNVPHRAVEVR